MLFDKVPEVAQHKSDVVIYYKLLLVDAKLSNLLDCKIGHAFLVIFFYGGMFWLWLHFFIGHVERKGSETVCFGSRLLFEQ